MQSPFVILNIKYWRQFSSRSFILVPVPPHRRIHILHHYMLSKRTDTPFWEYYSKCDVRKTLWENYRKRTNKQTNLFVDAIWASLGLYYDEFTFYE